STEYAGAHYHSRRADETGAKGVEEEIAGSLSMAPSWIDPDSVSHPELFSLRNHAFRISPHFPDLTLEFVGRPKIVGVQESHQRSARKSDADIAGRSRPAIVGAQHPDPSSHRLQLVPESCERIVGRAVVGHD